MSESEQPEPKPQAEVTERDKDFVEDLLNTIWTAMGDKPTGPPSPRTVLYQAAAAYRVEVETRARREAEDECMKRGHLTGRDLTKMQEEAKREGARAALEKAALYVELQQMPIQVNVPIDLPYFRYVNSTLAHGIRALAADPEVKP